ncbi:MAG: class I SAM-dependent methyltransferase [Polyangiaceae bacterium]
MSDPTSPRKRARELARAALDRGEPLAWFEELYREADQGAAIVPWADRIPNPHLRSWLEARGIRPGAAPRSRGRALDVGCGLGDNAAHLAACGFSVVAFDVSTTAVDAARKRFPELPITWCTADACDPPGAWASAFDLVAETYTLQVLPAQERARAARALGGLVAPGGTLLVIARGRDANEPEGSMPWPLLRTEIEAIGAGALELRSVDDFYDDEDPPVRRLRATFIRQG